MCECNDVGAEYLDDPLVGDIANVLLADKEAHDKNAREWTQRYAMIGKNNKSKDDKNEKSKEEK